MIYGHYNRKNINKINQFLIKTFLPNWIIILNFYLQLENIGMQKVNWIFRKIWCISIVSYNKGYLSLLINFYK